MSKIDARLTVACSSDGQRATLEVVAGDRLALTTSDLTSWLAGKGVRFGVDRAGLEALRAALSDGDFIGRQLIATGCKAEPGRDGRLAWVVALGGLRQGRERSDGSVDHRARNAICTVEAEQQLAEVLRAKPGLPGRKVSGEWIAAPAPRDGLPNLGPGVERRGQGIFARQAGVVFHREGETLDVVEHFVHDGHAGMTSGDLTASGSLTIRGNVESGSRVTCKADLHIEGYVEGALVIADGDVMVKGGLLGQGTAEIRAGGNLRASHADRAHLFCQGTLSLERNAVHTHAKAGAIGLGDGRGKWLGGEAAAETSVIVGECGSRSHDVTILAAAQPLGLRPAVTPRRPAAGRTGRGARARRTQMKERGAQLETRRQLRERQEELLPGAKVEVRGKVHPGTTILLGGHRYEVERALHRVRFRYDPEQRCVVTESL